MIWFWKSAPKTIRISQAESVDLSDCADIHEMCFSQNWATHTLASMLTSRGTKCLVAKTSSSKTKPVGFLMYRVSAGEAEILTVAVDPKQQSSGIGSALLDEMIRLCLMERLEEIFLEVDDSNLPALKIYKRNGFKKVGERKGYYGAKALNDEASANQSPVSTGNALIMRLDLSQ